MKKIIYSIAIIGGGFSGLSVTSNLIRAIQKNGVNAHITLYEANKSTGSGMFDINLPDQLTLNHETNYMGSVNPFSKTNRNDDFYNWLTSIKDQPLESLNGSTIASRYKKCDISNPLSYLPRSLYGHYLIFRLRELISKAQSKYYSFEYTNSEVVDITRQEKKFNVRSINDSKIFDFIILCTGYCYSKKSANVYNTQNPYEYLNQVDHLKPKKIGILGSSLSAIETALILAEKGYEDITLFSRNGRLPKVRGKAFIYQPRYITRLAIKKIKNRSKYIKLPLLISTLKKEFDYAYSRYNGNLYQKSGINWKYIINNTNPIQQLTEDINTVEKGEKLIWRSVILQLSKIELGIWPYLPNKDEKYILENYSSLISSFTAPMPLFQAKKLLKYISDDTIKLINNVSGYSFQKDIFKTKLNDGRIITSNLLIDARGPSKESNALPLLQILIDKEIVEKHAICGIRVNNNFQIKFKGDVLPNMYAVGSLTYGHAPLNNGTIFFENYGKIVCKNILKQITSNKEIEMKVGDNHD